MKKFSITSIVIATLLVSCSQESNEEQLSPSEPTSELTDSSALQTESLANETVELNIEERTQAFFIWYDSNSHDWYAKSNAVVGVKDNFYYLDTINLNKYISWLQETNYFSTSYVMQEEENWKVGCNDEMVQLKKDGEVADFIPPCVYEADILFLSQDVDVTEAVSKVSVTIDTISDSYAVVDYGVSKLYWIKENDVWKIASLHSKKH